MLTDYMLSLNPSSNDKKRRYHQETAHRYRISLGMVKNLLYQRRRRGYIQPRHRLSGRKPMILNTHQSHMRALLRQKPDLTLKEVRWAAGLNCTLQAIHYVLQKMGLTYKKRDSGPANKTDRTSRERGGSGGGSKPVGIRSR